MGVLTADMKRVVEQQRLGFVATVCPDGTPNLSPKGTTAVWDDDHLVFANIRSPGTLANLRHNAHVEVNVIDPLVRKGYRFKGVASVLESGPLYDKAIAFYQARAVPPSTSSAKSSWCRFKRPRRLIPRPMTWASPKQEVRPHWDATSNRFAAGRARRRQASNCRSEPPRLSNVR